MTRVRFHCSITLDGYMAGPDQTLEQPFGDGMESVLHDWMFKQRWVLETFGGGEGGEEGPSNHVIREAQSNIGATIMGRNMFGPPAGGAWPAEAWNRWWGPKPPYHTPVYVLTHYAREPLEMEGGTTFYFVTDGIQAALKRAKEAALGKDVRLGGGAATIRQYLTAGLIDEMHLAISPVLLGRGEHLLAGIDTVSLGYKCTEHASTDHATHVVLTK